ncbi:MAG: Tfp pilus assembly protein PilF [Parcubacteria bacterium C7867-004]|nr:MAG: Tfp pilus assembly protein PilF [Parcubacteria bacterium C7867-004]
MHEENITSRATAPRAARASFDIAATWAILATAALGTIAFLPSTNLPFISTKVTVIALGALVTLVLFILARLTRGNIIIPPVALLGSFWLVPLAYGLSALFSGNGLAASFFGSEFEIDTFGFVVMLAVLASLTALAFRRAPSFHLFYKAGSILLAVVILAQLLFLIVSKIMPEFIAPTATMIGSFPDLGMFLGLGVVLALLALRLLEVRDRTRTMLYVFGALALFLIALVNSIVVWTLIGLAALGLFIEAIMRNRMPVDDSDLDGVALLLSETDSEIASSARSLAAPLATLAISLFFIIGSGTLGSALVGAFGTNVTDVRPSWQSTFEIGSHTYASSPLFGSGPGTFGEQWVKFRDRGLNDTIFWNIDFPAGIGSIPTSFVTTGLAGALAWIAFIVLFLFIGVRALLVRLPENAFMRFVSVSSFTGTLYVLALMVFTVPGPVVLVSGFLLAGIFVSSLRYGAQAREWGIIFARSPRAGFVIVFGLTLLLLASILAAYVVVGRYLSNVAYADAAKSLAAGDLDAAGAAVTRSIGYAPSDRAYQVAAATGIASMSRIASDTTLSPADAQQRFQAVLSASIESALTATRLNPNNYQNWAVLGSVYQTVVPLNIEGAYENAKTAYDRSIALNPTSPILPFVVGQLEIAHKNPKLAEEQLLQAINLKHDYTQAIFLLSQLQVEQGRAKEALQAVEAAAYFAPNDPTILFQMGILRSANNDTAGAIVALARAVEVNPEYANARFFLAAMYAISGKFTEAEAQLSAIAAMSPENAAAVAADLAQVKAGKNPFPASRLGALGIPQAALLEANKGAPVPAGQ